LSCSRKPGSKALFGQIIDKQLGQKAGDRAP
jgi:hypothetical protein